MPRLSQRIIRAAFIYLLLGITIGSLLLAHKGLPFYPALWNWLPVHIEFLLFGWVVQVTMGMAFWILPRYWQQPRRPNEWAAQVAFGLLNLGIWLVVGATLLRGGRGVMLAGRVAEITAVIFFALHAWKRIVSRDGA
jgi:heme/copper-type cytochrome/quinol oxidase subunit 1